MDSTVWIGSPDIRLLEALWYPRVSIGAPFSSVLSGKSRQEEETRVSMR